MDEVHLMLITISSLGISHQQFCFNSLMAHRSFSLTPAH